MLALQAKHLLENVFSKGFRVTRLGKVIKKFPLKPLQMVMNVLVEELSWMFTITKNYQWLEVLAKFLFSNMLRSIIHTNGLLLDMI